MHHVVDHDATAAVSWCCFLLTGPSWQTPPLETQQIVTRLLPLLLHQHSPEHDSGKEVDDD